MLASRENVLLGHGGPVLVARARADAEALAHAPGRAPSPRRRPRPQLARRCARSCATRPRPRPAPEPGAPLALLQIVLRRDGARRRGLPVARGCPAAAAAAAPSSVELHGAGRSASLRRRRERRLLVGLGERRLGRGGRPRAGGCTRAASASTAPRPSGRVLVREQDAPRDVAPRTGRRRGTPPRSAREEVRERAGAHGECGGGGAGSGGGGGGARRRAARRRRGARWRRAARRRRERGGGAPPRRAVDARSRGSPGRARVLGPSRCAFEPTCAPPGRAQPRELDALGVGAAVAVRPAQDRGGRGVHPPPQHGAPAARRGLGVGPPVRHSARRREILVHGPPEDPRRPRGV